MKRAIAHLVVVTALAPLVWAYSSSTSPAATTAPQTQPAQSVPTATQVPTSAATPTAAQTSAGLGSKWSGTWTDTSPDTSSGTFSLTWTQVGNNLTGTIAVHGTPCITSGTVTGTLNGTGITFGAVSGQVTITYTGSVSGTKMQGTYSAPTCGDATGNWTASQG
jgi:hypothetical protein